MNIWFGVKKKGRDEVCSEDEGDECGVDVPPSENVLKLRIKLLKDGGRVSCHCCSGERCLVAYVFVCQLQLGEVNSDTKISPTVYLP